MKVRRIVGTLLLSALLGAKPDLSQSQSLFSETFDSCRTGRLSCDGWSGDGFVERLRGDNVLVLRAAETDTIISLRIPETGYRVNAGESYRLSAAIRTDALDADFSIGVWTETESGRVSPFVMQGMRETTSWHRIDLPFTPAQDGHVGISISVGAGTGIVYLDDIMILPSHSSSSEPGLSNACPEGQFADLAHSENTCRDLHVRLGDLSRSILDQMERDLHLDVQTITSGHPSARLGFDPALFDSGMSAHMQNRIEVTDCDAGAILTAIREGIEAGGGVIKLPECTIKLDQPITISGGANLIIEGHGIGRTILEQRQRLRPGPAIHIKHGSNVIVRDMSLHLNNVRFSNIQIVGSSNVLIERVLVKDAGSASIRSAHTTRMTVRYSTMLRGPKSINDPGCQGDWFRADKSGGVRDIDLDGDGKGSTHECEMNWDADFTPGSVWSASYAAYSNFTNENSLSLHSSLGEIAGNRFFRSTASKLSDAHFWWIHDNEFRENQPGGTRTASFRTTSDGIVDRQSHHNVIYRNRFVNTVNRSLRIAGSDTYLIQNEYQNDSGSIKIMAGTMVCEGSDELIRLDVQQPEKRRLAIVPLKTGGICDLESPGMIWSHPDISSEE